MRPPWLFISSLLQAYGLFSCLRAEAALAALSPEEWTAERLLEALKAAAEGAGVKLGDLMQPVRVVLTGTTVSEPVNELLLAVGREESLRRLAAIR